MYRIVNALQSAELQATARELISEYIWMTAREVNAPWAHSGELPPKLATECNELQTVYAAPGSLLLAMQDEAPAGCVGLHSMGEDRAAVQRLWVRPQHQGSGLGRLLMEQCFEESRRNDITSLVLDVIPTRTSVIDWYRRLGFEEVEPFETLSVPMIFLGRSVPPKPLEVDL